NLASLLHDLLPIVLLLATLLAAPRPAIATIGRVEWVTPEHLQRPRGSEATSRFFGTTPPAALRQAHPSRSNREMHRVLLAILAVAAAARSEVLTIPNSLDNAPQQILLDVPTTATGPVPLLVHLHSWSATFDKSSEIDVARAEAKRRSWAFLSPDFRGPNDKPAACGSELAIQDVHDAVAEARRRTQIDDRRIYLLGGSGGGYMTLVMAARAPQLWAAASAWVPISDLAAWYHFSKSKDARYWKMLEGCFGGAPPSGLATQQYRRRSPLFFLSDARGLPLDINTGIHDGHTGSVPVDHSLRAFNALAPPALRIAEKDIQTIVREEKVPAHLAPLAGVEKEARKQPVLLRRTAGKVRLTVFEGGHETDFAAGIAWLETHTRPAFTLDLSLRDNQVLQRDAANRAKPAIPESPGMLTRVNGGPWRRGVPTLAAGGPYRIEFQKDGSTAVRTGILVGDVYILAGQSNMVGRAPLAEAAAPHPRVRAFTPQDTWEQARDPLHETRHRPDGVDVGAGLGIPFATEMVRRTGVPVGLIPCAVGGTSLEQWNPAHAPKHFRRSLYGNCIARAKLTGGGFKAILWYQGEADASRVSTAETYFDRFRSLVESFRRDLAQPDLPIYFAQLSRHVNTTDPTGWNLVRDAQRRAEIDMPNAAVVATIDLTLTDPIHLDAPSQRRLGLRFATRVLDGDGPRLVSAAWEDSATVRLKFNARLRADGSRILGFTATGAALFHATFDRASGDVMLHLSRAGNETVSIAYCQGLDPVCNLSGPRDLPLPAFGPVALRE
ncbi:MAG: sialate O-acetylesterase, partial [Bryobacteraceae bacterium]